MKAYQLKIVIKNSRPPIWRRCVVPAGITFSQLGVILNNVMGWSGYHLSAFEFYHLKLRFEELVDEISARWEYDLAESSEHVIDRYMESEDWFTYLYDFGDHWAHRVTIENVIPDYQYNHPIVGKFKGNCPPEDCGGIEGYYALLEQQPIEDVYDLEEINKLFEENFTIQYDAKPDTRRKYELYEELVFKGRSNLKVMKNGDKVYTKSKIIISKSHMLSNSPIYNLNEISEKLEYNNSIEQLEGLTLEEFYHIYLKQDVREIAKFHHLECISSYNKPDLIKKTIHTILEKSYFFSYFSCLRDSEMDIFLRSMEENVEYEDCDDDIRRIYLGGYCTVTEDGYVVIPTDVKEVFEEINTASFHTIRKRRSAVLDCLIAANFLYGFAPLGVISNMLWYYTGSAYLIKDINAEAEAVPYCLRDFSIMDDEFIASDLLFNKQLENLHTIQGDKEYYLPTHKEILELASLGYIRNDKILQKFQKYLEEKMNAPLDIAIKVSKRVQREIMTGQNYNMQRIFDIMESSPIKPKDQKQLSEFVDLLSELWNSTRMTTNRGFKPNELVQENKNKSIPFVNQKIIDFHQANKSKIYPNDKCPCGSGKKYKHCCG